MKYTKARVKRKKVTKMDSAKSFFDNGKLSVEEVAECKI